MLTVKLNPPTHINTELGGLKTPWFGDYWRDLIPFGIWRPVRLVTSGKVRIDDVYARTRINKNSSADVDMEIVAEILQANQCRWIYSFWCRDII